MGRLGLLDVPLLGLRQGLRRPRTPSFRPPSVHTEEGVLETLRNAHGGQTSPQSVFGSLVDLVLRTLTGHGPRPTLPYSGSTVSSLVHVCDGPLSRNLRQTEGLPGRNRGEETSHTWVVDTDGRMSSTSYSQITYVFTTNPAVPSLKPWTEGLYGSRNGRNGVRSITGSPLPSCRGKIVTS